MIHKSHQLQNPGYLQPGERDRCILCQSTDERRLELFCVPIMSRVDHQIRSAPKHLTVGEYEDLLLMIARINERLDNLK